MVEQMSGMRWVRYLGRLLIAYGVAGLLFSLLLLLGAFAWFRPLWAAEVVAVFYIGIKAPAVYRHLCSAWEQHHFSLRPQP